MAYARAALADPKVRAKYERTAKKQGKRPWDVALSDYFEGKNLLTPTAPAGSGYKNASRFAKQIGWHLFSQK